MAEQFLHEPADGEEEGAGRGQIEPGSLTPQAPDRDPRSGPPHPPARPTAAPCRAVTPARSSSSSVWPHCEVSTGRLHRLSTPPRLAARLKTLQPIEEARGAIVAAAEVEAHHPAEAAHLLRRDRVIRMLLEARVVDRLHPAVVRRASGRPPCALALWRSIRTDKRLQSRGRARRPRTDRARCRASCAHRGSEPSSAPAPASAPAVTSLWPFRYFVALCITRSTPSAIGCWLIGLAKVLSMTEITPRARHARATAAMSTQRSVGLIGDSNQTSFVARREDRLRPRQLLERHEARLDPELRQQVGEQVQRAAVDRGAADDFVARFDAAPSARSSSPPVRSTAPAPPRPLRAPRSSARPASPSGSRSASRGTSTIVPRCTPRPRRRSRTRTSSSRRSASSAAPRRDCAPSDW